MTHSLTVRLSGLRSVTRLQAALVFSPPMVARSRSGERTAKPRTAISQLSHARKHVAGGCCVASAFIACVRVRTRRPPCGHSNAADTRASEPPPDSAAPRAGACITCVSCWSGFVGEKRRASALEVRAREALRIPSASPAAPPAAVSGVRPIGACLAFPRCVNIFDGPLAMHMMHCSLASPPCCQRQAVCQLGTTALVPPPACRAVLKPSRVILARGSRGCCTHWRSQAPR